MVTQLRREHGVQGLGFLFWKIIPHYFMKDNEFLLNWPQCGPMIFKSSNFPVFKAACGWGRGGSSKQQEAFTCDAAPFQLPIPPHRELSHSPGAVVSGKA